MTKKQLKHPASIHEFGPFLKKQKLLGSFAEIGVAEGRSSLEFMNWGFKRCYLVDVWKHIEQPGDAAMPQEWHDENLRMCHEKMDKFGKKVIYLQGFSKDMAEKVKDKSLDFVYLDGDHSYMGARNDLSAWTPKIKDGGVMAGHDFNDNYGVKEAVYDFVGGVAQIEKVHVLPEQHVDNQGFWFYVSDIR